MENREYKSQLFRLATVLYADNNYEVAPKTIHKKIIESALLSNDNKPIGVNKLIDAIHEKYNIHFDIHEVQGIIKAERDECFLLNEKHNEIIVCLSEKRKNILKQKLSNKTIDYFIEQFEKENAKLLVGHNTKDILYRFLYELLSTNIESFKKLIDSKKKIEELINLEANTYSPIEREIVNSFLGWPNSEKDKAIFDIASYALEYCMISNNSSSATVHLTELRNKVFYLDTNVIFRALGINGANRKNRTITFLKKFLEANETLKLSKFSEVEFKESIKFYVGKLRERPLKSKLNPVIFEEKFFRGLSDIYDFYYKWRVGKVNDSLDLFEAHILSLYEVFKKDFLVDTDYAIPFDLTEEKQRKPIENMANDISSFKTSELVSHGYESDLCDACNVTLIEKRRDGKSLNLFDSKFFFISTDQSLRRWDYNRNMLTPIVILPSQWLSILLRYVNRTSDDFRSFVSFLNLPLPDTQIKAERLHLILSGISEMTSNFEQQRFIVQTLVQNKFEGILEKGLDEEEIVERTKQFAKTALEHKLDQVQSQHDTLKSEIEDHKKVTEKTIEELTKDKESKEGALEEREQENARLKQELRDNFIQRKFKNWRRWGYIAIPAALLIIMFFTFQLFFTTFKYNYVQRLIEWIDNNGCKIWIGGS